MPVCWLRMCRQGHLLHEVVGLCALCVRRMPAGHCSRSSGAVADLSAGVSHFLWSRRSLLDDESTGSRARCSNFAAPGAAFSLHAANASGVVSGAQLVAVTTAPVGLAYPLNLVAACVLLPVLLLLLAHISVAVGHKINLSFLSREGEKMTLEELERCFESLVGEPSIGRVLLDEVDSLDFAHNVLGLTDAEEQPGVDEALAAALEEGGKSEWAGSTVALSSSVAPHGGALGS